jgi:hypothetical protein
MMIGRIYVLFNEDLTLPMFAKFLLLSETKTSKRWVRSFVETETLVAGCAKLPEKCE